MRFSPQTFKQKQAHEVTQCGTIATHKYCLKLYRVLYRLYDVVNNAVKPVHTLYRVTLSRSRQLTQQNDSI